MNGWHEPSTHPRQLPQYEGSGLILIALVGLFLFTGAKIGWLLAALIFVGAPLALVIFALLALLALVILSRLVCLIVIPVAIIVYLILVPVVFVLGALRGMVRGAR